MSLHGSLSRVRQTCLHSTDLQFLQVRGAPNIILTRKECYYWQSHNLCRENATFSCHHKKDGKLLETHDSLHYLHRLCYLSPVLKIKQEWFSCAENFFLLVYSHKVSLYLQIWWWNDSVFTEMRKNLVINSLRGPADITNNPSMDKHHPVSTKGWNCLASFAMIVVQSIDMTYAHCEI